LFYTTPNGVDKAKEALNGGEESVVIERIDQINPPLL
jgi:hypothetical protein